MAIETTTLGGGCFWCLEAVYDELEGVTDVLSGYMGGEAATADYKTVCSGRTAHAEVVQVKFDNEVVSYEDILNVFFTIHDPTTLNRQGADVGPQYRSVIFTHSDEQKETAEAKIKQLEAEGVWSGIVTEVTEAHPFYVAEDYHQDYYANNPYQGYCMMVVAPKVKKFRKKFTDRLKA